MLPSVVRRWLNRPKKSDPRLLAKFFYIDEEVGTIVHELQCLDVRKDPQNYLVLLSQLHNSQERMLAILEQILEQCVPTKRRKRDYHLKFPDDIVNNTMTTHLLFAAELLVGGTYVEVDEADGILLRPLAQELLRSLECLRRVLREQSLEDPGIYQESTHKPMLQYDNLCAEFELRYMSLVVSVKSPEEIYEQQEVAVLFCETVSRALKRGYLTQEMIDDCEPELMISIPRLAIISGLLIFPDGPLNLEKPPEEMCELFSPFYGLLKKIRELLCILTEDELLSLERALCSSSEDSTTRLPPCVPTSSDSSSSDNTHQSVNTQLSSASEQTLQNTPWINVPHSNIAACNSTVSGAYFPCSQQSNVAVDSEYMRSQDLKLMNSTRRPAEILRSVHIRCSIRGSKLSEVRSRYRSDSDMLHRLFVCIAGVADQLQTNFASDLRVILKTVFETVSSRQQVDTQSETDWLREYHKKTPPYLSEHLKMPFIYQIVLLAKERRKLEKQPLYLQNGFQTVPVLGACAAVHPLRYCEDGITVEVVERFSAPAALVIQHPFLMFTVLSLFAYVLIVITCTAVLPNGRERRSRSPLSWTLVLALEEKWFENYISCSPGNSADMDWFIWVSFLDNLVCVYIKVCTVGPCLQSTSKLLQGILGIHKILIHTSPIGRPTFTI